MESEEVFDHARDLDEDSLDEDLDDSDSDTENPEVENPFIRGNPKMTNKQINTNTIESSRDERKDSHEAVFEQAGFYIDADEQPVS